MGRILFPVTDRQGNRTYGVAHIEVRSTVARWSDPSFWEPYLGSRRLPTINDNVSLSLPVPLVFDVDDGAIGTLEIHSPFSVAPGTARRLQVGGNFVQHHGLFQVVTSDLFEMHWPRVDERTFVGGGMDVLPTDPGLWLMGADVDIQGVQTTPWALATTDLQPGQTQITLDRDPVGWRVGGEVVIAPTLPATTPGFRSYTLPVPGTPRNDVPLFVDAYDEATITAISGRTITLSRPLTYAHPRCGPWQDGTFEGAEVLYLSRNIRFTGRPLARPHIMVMAMNEPVSIVANDWEGRYLGPVGPDPNRAGRYIGVLGRYGFHMHFMRDYSRGARVERAVLRDLGGHAFVAHASHGVTFDGCVAHNVFRAAPFWWDRGRGNESRDVLWIRTVSSRVMNWPEADSELTGYELNAGWGNRVIDARGFGTHGLSNSSALMWTAGESGETGGGVWDVRGFRGHNCQKAWFTWQNTENVHEVGAGSRLYRCQRAILAGAYRNRYQYQLFEARECPVHFDEVAVSYAYPDPWPAPSVVGAVFHGSPITSHHVGTEEHTQAPPRPSRYDSCIFKGPLASTSIIRGGQPAAFLIHYYERHPDWKEVVNCQFLDGIREFWFTDTCHPGSRVIWRRNDGTTLELRRRDQPGDYYEPRWNASVRRL